MVDRQSPARLFVYLARDAPLGVVLRRGPSAWARLSLWHTDTDSFDHGQWMRARVYERRCDISADASLFVAFVGGSSGPAIAGEQAGTWLALSRPPWFTALAVWFVGSTWCAGGFFPNPRALWIGDTSAPDRGALPDWLEQSGRPPPYIERSGEWTERLVHVNRLLRDGWTPEGPVEATLTGWRREQPSGAATLMMEPTTDLDLRAYGGRHVVEYGVACDGEVDALGRATWADIDQRGRIVLAQEGRLLHWQGLGDLRVIEDFNPQRPDPAQAPDWAVAPPAPPAKR
jgi:hypothetical protein